MNDAASNLNIKNKLSQYCAVAEIDQDEDFHYFELLPKSIQKIVQHAFSPISAQSVYTVYQQYGEQNTKLILEKSVGFRFFKTDL